MAVDAPAVAVRALRFVGDAGLDVLVTVRMGGGMMMLERLIVRMVVSMTVPVSQAGRRSDKRQSLAGPDPLRDLRREEPRADCDDDDAGCRRQNRIDPVGRKGGSG